MTQLSELLDNATLSRLERHRLAAAHFTSNRRGERLSRGRGRSTDFSDYRDYVAGDDIRFVDWNIFARLRRPYLKLYHEEEERHLALLLDCSASMGFEDKLRRACQVALALGLVGLVGGERVSVYAIRAGEADPALLRPGRGRRRLTALCEALEGLSAHGDLAPERAVTRMLERHRGRGIAVVLSDFLSFGEAESCLQRLASAGLEPWVGHILGPSERDPELSDDLRLVDAEQGHTLDVSAAGELLSLYREYLHAFEQRLAAASRSQGGRYLRIDTVGPPEPLVLERLVRESWIQLR